GDDRLGVGGRAEDQDADRRQHRRAEAFHARNLREKRVSTISRRVYSIRGRAIPGGFSLTTDIAIAFRPGYDGACQTKVWSKSLVKPFTPPGFCEPPSALRACPVKGTEIA